MIIVDDYVTSAIPDTAKAGKRAFAIPGLHGDLRGCPA